MSLAVSSGGGYNDGPKSASSSSMMRRSSSSSSVVLNVETIRLHASSMVARMMSRVSVDTLRPLPMFVGVVTAQQQQHSSKLCFAGGAYTPPIRKFDKASLEKVKSRVSLNFAFFLSNYVLVAAMVGLVVALMHPGMLFFVGICYGLWTFHAFLIRNELELFGVRVHSLLSIQQRFYLNFAVTAAVVLWKCLRPALIFVLLSTLIVATHAFLRDPRHIEAMDAAASSSDEHSALSPSGGGSAAGVVLRSSSNDHGSDDEYDDEEANMGSSAGSSGSEKGAVLVDRPTSGAAGNSAGGGAGGGMTKRRGDVI